MAKIIKVGSQNPTFTSQKVRKNASIQTRRNSNEATNPFKFTNFEGNTLQFADVFEGFKPNFKANKMRMVASSVAGSMHKMRASIAEPIINFVKRVHSGLTSAWDYASTTNFTVAMSDAANAINPNIKTIARFSLKGFSVTRLEVVSFRVFSAYQIYKSHAKKNVIHITSSMRLPIFVF